LAAEAVHEVVGENSNEVRMENLFSPPLTQAFSCGEREQPLSGFGNSDALCAAAARVFAK
jgi:hypothetical protein